MDQAQFDREVGEVKALGAVLESRLKALDDGATDAELAKTEPRDPEEVKTFRAGHLKAAKESGLAEAKYLAAEAAKILLSLAASGAKGAATGGIA